MKTKIHLNKGIGINKINFPDSQIHISLNEDVLKSKKTDLECSLCTYSDVVQLLLVSNSLSDYGIEKNVLTINYLISSRYDRKMFEGDSFDLKIIADLINSCDFNKVRLLNVHSNVSTDLINNSISFECLDLYKEYEPTKNTYLICPDKGAVTRTKYVAKYIGKLKGIIYCNKERDIEGRITLKIGDLPKDITESEIVIVDDLCDGGGTFIAIASQLPKEIKKTLIITHGIFSKGFTELNKHFDKIICTNSFSDIPDYYNNGMKRFKTNVKQIKL